MLGKALVHMLRSPQIHTGGLRIYQGQLQINNNPWIEQLRLANAETYHLYFTTDEEIKEGDWYISNQAPRLCVEVRKGNKYPYGHRGIDGEMVYDFHTWKTKIVATTNPDLWEKKIRMNAAMTDYNTRTVVDIPKIPTSFLEAYAQAEGKITEVMLEYDEIGEEIDEEENVTHIHRLKLRNNGTVIIHRVQQKLYTRDEVFDILVKSSLPHMDDWDDEHTEQYDIERLRQWFDKNYPE
jgi:ligand-binding SRPBCC domain-containing protein